MSKSSALPQRIAAVVTRNRLSVQVLGVSLAAVGFGLVRWLVPASLAAQVSATLFGAALVLFAQFFHRLQKLKPEDRLALDTMGICCLAVCLAAALGATGYHWQDASRGTSGAGGALTPSTEVSFARDEPNTLVIHVPGRNWRNVAAQVQKIWTLAPDQPGPTTIDWPHEVNLELEVEKATPYQVETLSGAEVPITVTLRPVVPDSSADLVQVEQSLATRIKFAKPPQDYVFLLKLDVVNVRGKAIGAGSVLYLPELNSRYQTPTTSVNQDVLRELSKLQLPMSRKLADLLSAHKLLLGSKK